MVAEAEWPIRYRRVAAGIFLAAAFAEGFASSGGVFPRALNALLEASSIVVWCALDARIHGKLFLRPFVVPMMVTWPVGVIVHLIWTRRAKGIFVYLVTAVICVLAAGGGRGIWGLVTSG